MLTKRSRLPASVEAGLGIGYVDEQEVVVAACNLLPYTPETALRPNAEMLAIMRSGA